jgi:hypothetical protein
MKTKRKSRRRILRKKKQMHLKINLRKKGGGYSLHEKMLINPHNKVSPQPLFHNHLANNSWITVNIGGAIGSFVMIAFIVAIFTQ